MISNEHKCIFVHMGKTGGSTVETLLDPNISTSHQDRSGELGNTDLPKKHWTASKYKKHYPNEFEEYYKFSFVRNPWDMLVSAWEWFKFIGWNKPDFKTFVFGEAHKPWFSYENFIMDEDRKEVIVDDIGRFEYLQEDIPRILSKVGLEVGEIPHINKLVDRKPYQEYYDNETMQKVEESFPWAIDRFGYKF